ncbi:hypothetical protein D3C80_1209830 [compost metagenome]
MLQHLAAADGDAGQGIVSDLNRQTGMVADLDVQAAQQGAAARQHDALVGDVGSQFRRGRFQRDLDGLDDLRDRLGQGFGGLALAHLHFARHALHQVAALDLDRQAFAVGRDAGGADVLLDALGGRFPDQQVMVAAHVADDGVVHHVAADADRTRIDDARQRQDGDLGRAAADVDDHRAGRLVDRQAGADRGGHGLVDQADAAGRGVQAGIIDGAALDGRGARGDADDHLGVHEALAVMNLADEVLDHLFGDFEVGDDPVAHRTDGFHVAGRAAQHLLGFQADGVDDLAAADVAQGDDRRLVQDDALAAHVDQGVGRPQIHRDVVGDHAEEG